MLNYETRGSELATQLANPAKSTHDIITNEDWSMVVEVYDVNEGIVQGYKVWDMAVSKTLFSATLEYLGHPGTPPDDVVKIGQHVIFYRVGEYKGTGNAGYELHIEDPLRTSWVCFVGCIPVIFVQDLGNNTGKEVVYSSGAWQTPAWSEILTIKTADPLNVFEDDAPPFQAGRIYAAQKIAGIYIVFLLGQGPLEKTFEASAGGITWAIDVDGQGNVKNFTAEEAI